jgi:excisionase family DNA binding protein
MSAELKTGESRAGKAVASTKSFEPLLRTTDVAAIANVEPSTVLDWVEKGRLPAVKINARTFRFRRSDVEALLQ